MSTETKSMNHSDGFLGYLLRTRMYQENHEPCLRRVVTVNINDSVPGAMRRLSAENISSAPVTEASRYVGFVSMADMVKAVTNLFWGTTEQQWSTWWKSAEFQGLKVRDIMSSAENWGKKEFAPDPIYESQSTLSALEMLVNQKAVRAIVLNNRFERDITNICTQSMIISEIRQHMNDIHTHLREKSVQEMVDIWQDVVSVKDNDFAINAFKKMAALDISAVAIVNSDGALTGCLSEKDLVGLGASGTYFSRLFDTVANFKRDARKEVPRLAASGHFSAAKKPLRAIYVTKSDTFEDVIHKMKDGNIKRVFVCEPDDDGHMIPQYVIAQHDILQQVFEFYMNSI